MDTSKAKWRLQSYQTMQRDLCNQLDRLKRLNEQIEAPGGQKLTGMPKAPGCTEGKMSLLIAKKVDLEKQIDEAMEIERLERKGIETIIGRMNNPDEKAIIRLRYFDNAEWGDINNAIHGRRKNYLSKTEGYLRQTYRKHGTALISFTKAMQQ